MSHILIVDDEEAVCWALQKALTQEGYSTSVAASAEEAFTLAARHEPDVVFLDVRLPGMDGLTALGKLKKIVPEAAVIIATAFGNLDLAVNAVEAGAFDYLAKPFDLSQVLDAVACGLRPRAPRSRVQGPRIAAPETDEIVGRSPAMQLVFKRIALVAPRESCVLITGESGTGKELVARAIHRHSQRREQPFLPVHVAALNPNLVESELFGHVKGAFTGAGQTRQGLLSLAEGGTVFLDELAEIPLPVQVKLLRVLERGEVIPVGGTQPQVLNIRILSATHQDLGRRVSEGTFRHDLFFRLNAFQIHLPPLRERVEDVVALCEFFLNRLEPRLLPLAPETIKYLTSLPWLGNVRELRHALEHASIVAHAAPLLPEHFPVANQTTDNLTGAQQLAGAVRRWLAYRIKEGRGKAPAGLYDELLQCLEAPLLDEVMRRVQGNRYAAGQLLGLSRVTVRKKLAQFGLTAAHLPEGKSIPPVEEDEEY